MSLIQFTKLIQGSDLLSSNALWMHYLPYRIYQVALPYYITSSILSVIVLSIITLHLVLIIDYLLCPVPLSDVSSVVTCLDKASRYAKEAADSLLPFLHGQAPEVCCKASKDGSYGSDEGIVQEVCRTVRKEKG